MVLLLFFTLSVAKSSLIGATQCPAALVHIYSLLYGSVTTKQ